MINKSILSPMKICPLEKEINLLKNIKDTNLELERYPLTTNDKFLAWDASDKYIINHLNSVKTNYKNVLIIEDEFGAIGLSIEAEEIYFVNDSILSRKGILNNFILNDITTSNITFLSPFEQFPRNIDLIILKIPKVNYYLEFLLNKLNNTYSFEVNFIAGSMVKHLNSTIYELCKSHLSDFMYSLSWKKAKVITGKLKGVSSEVDFIIKLNEFDLTLINYANLFSLNKLDIGTRFLLDNLDNIPYPDKIVNLIDVGSANGILGLKLLPYAPKCNLWLTDISFSAYESAKATIIENKLDVAQIHLITDNSLDAFTDNFAEMIVINPPFHQNHKVTISISLNIFQECKRVLREHGTLIVVANKHLGYHVHLAKIFREVEVIKQNSKFIILLAKK